MIEELIAISIIQGGPGFPAMLPAAYRYVYCGDYQSHRRHTRSHAAELVKPGAAAMHTSPECVNTKCCCCTDESCRF